MTALNALGHDAWLLDPADVKLVEALHARPTDLCWLALHGKEGEDGTVQRLLDLLGLPYTGTPAFDCELAFDKVLAKDVLRRAGVPTPDWVAIEGSALRDLGAGAALPRALERIGLPCIVKPSRSGSALGVSAVEREADLAGAVMGALSFSGAADRGADDPRDRGRRGRSSARRWTRCPSSRSCRRTASTTTAHGIRPARPSTSFPRGWTQVSPRRFAMRARAAVDALRIRGVGRVDVLVDAEGGPQVLEVNVSPGMTETSLLPMAAEASGIAFGQLCDDIIRGSDDSA